MSDDLKIIGGIIALAVIVFVCFGAGMLAQKTIGDPRIEKKTVVKYTVLPNLPRRPDSDSAQVGPQFQIVCTGYSNRPKLKIKPPYNKRYIGFRIVTDCVTLPLDKLKG